MIKLRKQSCHKLSHHQQGFTLVEIMVAVAISVFLLAGILQVMSGNKQTSRYQEAVARIQENARFALMFLGRDFRQAGYMGCTGNDFTNQLDLANNTGIGSADRNNFFNLQNPVAGWEAGSSSPGADGTAGDTFTITNTSVAMSSWDDHNSADLEPSFAALTFPPLEGSDVVIVKYAQESPSGATATGTTVASAATIDITVSSDIPQNTIMLVTDCINSDLFQTANDGTGTTLSRGVIAAQVPGNLNPSSWSHQYDGSMKIMLLVSNVYFVAQGSYGGPSLWQANFNTGSMSAPQELVEGVENMQVLYGEDTTADSMADRYVTMDNVSNIANIVSVRVSLLMRSIEQVKINAPAAGITKTINGVDVTSQSDRNLRFVVTSTYKIRNRGVL